MIIGFSKLQSPNYSGDLKSVWTSANNFSDPDLEKFPSLDLEEFYHKSTLRKFFNC